MTGAGLIVAGSGSAEAAADSRGGIPHVEGPVTGGQRGHIFGGFVGDDLAAHGYVEDEYFVSGVAQCYAPVGDLNPDGRWCVKRDTTAPYKTRVIVHRPKDPAKFNGVLICEWTNVSAFIDVSNAVNESFHRSGFAYAAISAQKMGVEGLDSAPETGLRRWDPERYGTLQIPGDGYSYDIFTQVARALASSKPGHDDIDPMPGLKVEHVVATGESQSAARLTSYINAIHSVEEFFSAFIPCVLVGGGSELYNPEIIPGESKDDYNKRFFARIVPCTIRDDLRVPILVMLSETEARSFRIPPQPDSDRLRVWEVAGAVHGSACDVGYRSDTSARDGITDPFGKSTQRMVRFMPTMAAAALTMVQWAEGGAPLERHSRLLRRGDDSRTIETDANGNALGGVRLPEITVPTATFETIRSPAFGVRTAFSADKIRSMYPTDGVYIDVVRAAVAESLTRRLILPDRADEYLAEAAKGPLAQNP